VGGTVAPTFSSSGIGVTNAGIDFTNTLASAACKALTVFNTVTNNPNLLVIQDGVAIPIGGGFALTLEGLTNANQISVSAQSGTNSSVVYRYVN
jgi:Ethanolamine utilization protein EutJ (predicted chaperonin)